MLGRDVATVVDGAMASGTHEIRFNAASLPSGMYLYKLTSGSFAQVKKMTLMK